MSYSFQARKLIFVLAATAGTIHAQQAAEAPAVPEASPQQAADPQPQIVREVPQLSIPRGSIPYPKTFQEKLHQYMRDTYGPVALVGTLAGTGFAQARGEPDEWGGGADALGRRFASRAGRFYLRSTIRFGLDAALHIDSHYKRCDCSGVWPRLSYAMSRTVIARKDDGGATFAIPRVAAAYSAAVISSRWLPASQQSAGDILVSGSLNLVYDSGRNVLKEFWPDIKHKLFKK